MYSIYLSWANFIFKFADISAILSENYFSPILNPLNTRKKAKAGERKDDKSAKVLSAGCIAKVAGENPPKYEWTISGKSRGCELVQNRKNCPPARPVG